MKKQYTLMTIIIAVMVFLLFGGAAFAYTYFKAGSRDLMNVECTGDCNDIYVYNFEFSCTDHVNDQRIKYSYISSIV